MKITSVTPIDAHYVVTDDPDMFEYIRHTKDYWTVRMSGSEEIYDNCAELEALFQEWQSKGESKLPVIPGEIIDIEWEEEYFLCSAELLEHFPNMLNVSEPFKSGYEFDKDEVYYVVLTDGYEEIENYYKKVIEPFNEKSKGGTVDFWMKPITNSSIPNAPRGCITKCRRLGIFGAIEQIWNLTNETNRAFAIFKMAEYYGIDPIEFVDKIGSKGN